MEINPKLALNINPKYVWSGTGNTGALGIGINYKVNNIMELIPEINLNFSDWEQSNSAFIFRYSKSENRSLDLYVSNAAGTQDIGQLINLKEFRYGFKLNLII